MPELVPEPEPEPTQIVRVRALADFRPAQNGDLALTAGCVVLVTDTSDPDWWSGHLEQAAAGAAGRGTALRVRVDIICHARIKYVGKYQSCMV